MKAATRDRGEIIHWAGLHGLSPALRQGAPALASGPDPELARCGWEAFFAALEGRGLAMAYEPEDPSSTTFVPLAEAGDLRRGHGSLAGALAHSRRLLAALFRREPAPPDG